MINDLIIKSAKVRKNRIICGLILGICSVKTYDSDPIFNENDAIRLLSIDSLNFEAESSKIVDCYLSSPHLKYKQSD